MNARADLPQLIKNTLITHGFRVADKLWLEASLFDLVAEDDTHLLFLVFRSDNNGWFEDFRTHQASLAETLSNLHLGKKWRDVYLVEITSDPIDNDTELRMSEAIGSDTLVARKVIVDASDVASNDQQAIESLLGVILPPVPPAQTDKDINVMQSLRDHLVENGFSNKLVTSMITSFTSGGSNLAQLVLEQGP